MHTETVTLDTGGGEMNAYIAYPQAKGKSPALIVLQEAFGVNHHIKNVCQRLAKEGYVAIAPELYHRAGTGIDIKYDEIAKARPIMAETTNDMLAADIFVTLKYLKSLDSVQPTHIATIGFCMGGFASLLAACRLPLAAAISFYGAGVTRKREGIGFSPLLSELKNISCPVLLVFGEKDHTITPDDIEVIEEELQNSQKKFAVQIYPKAEHGFMCDERSAYNAEAAHKAWKSSLDWLSDALRND